MSKTIPLRPRLSEKTYGLSESRVYVLEIPRDVNKHNIARAVEAQFEVKVKTVNVANIPGKSKRTVSISGKRLSNRRGRRSDLKKAYVTLAEGHSLPFFNAIEEETQQEQDLQEKVDKAATKQAAKETKPARRGFRLPKRSKTATEEDK
jgi:large subunit ribosomal protein L23